ncbi:MAG TPA: hypothetical protein VGG64_07595 [Pirellulales bacterium]
MLWLMLVPTAWGQNDPADHEPPRLPPPNPSVYLRVLPGESLKAAPSSSIPPEPSVGPVLPQVARSGAPNSALAPAASGMSQLARGASELWMVSTRRLVPNVSDGSPYFAPDVSRYVGGRGWVPSSLEELVRTPQGTSATTVFVHGNDTNDEFAVRGGTNLFSELLGNPTAPAPPTRFVVWSWPNEPTTLRVRKIAQANAGRVNVEGYYLAAFLQRTVGHHPTGVVGYSSGAGVVTGALHVLGGGTLVGYRLASAPLQSAGIHAVLLGAAVPNEWLYPGRLHERALSQVEKLVITVNPADSVLRWYPLLWGKGGPGALGATGIPNVSLLGSEQSKVVQLNVQGDLSNRHSWRYYAVAPQVISLLRQEVSELPATSMAGAMPRQRYARMPQEIPSSEQRR